MGHPFGVLLLDELEKAHPTVHDRLLQLVDEGAFITRLRETWQRGSELSELARVYGRDGAGARDPRTGTQHPRLKDVLKGDLTPFLDAWRRLP